MTKISDSPGTQFEKNEPKPDSAKKSGETDRDLGRDADKFSDLMKKPLKKTGKNPGEKRDAAGDSILQAFQSRQANTPMEQPAAAASRSKISDVATQIADRILVSDASLDGKQEVRIQLKESVLPGTEVRISKEGGAIRVELATVNADSYRFLAEQQTGLQDHLKSRLGENVQVQVTTAETRGDTQDGRSRQQRDLYGELQDRED
jgi:type III secretion system needle length determinant